MTPNELLERWRGSEDGHQAALFAWANMAARYGWAAANNPAAYYNREVAEALRLQETVIPTELALMFAIPNGGSRHIATAAKLKATGVRRGVHDMFLPVSRHGYHGLFIELKKPGGRATKEQRLYHELLEAQKYKVCVCEGWEHASAVLRYYVQNDLQTQH